MVLMTKTLTTKCVYAFLSCALLGASPHLAPERISSSLEAPAAASALSIHNRDGICSHSLAERGEALRKEAEAKKQEQFVKSRTLAIFDWDDTLFPTTYRKLYVRQKIKNGMEGWKEPGENDFRKDVVAGMQKLLDAATKVAAKVVIVTNGTKGWVKKGLKELGMEEDFFERQEIKVFEPTGRCPASNKHRCRGHNCANTWNRAACYAACFAKTKRFEEALEAFREDTGIHSEAVNVLSFGDGDDELWATQDLHAAQRSGKLDSDLLKDMFSKNTDGKENSSSPLRSLVNVQFVNQKKLVAELQQKTQGALEQMKQKERVTQLALVKAGLEAAWLQAWGFRTRKAWLESCGKQRAEKEQQLEQQLEWRAKQQLGQQLGQQQLQLEHRANWLAQLERVRKMELPSIQTELLQRGLPTSGDCNKNLLTLTREHLEKDMGEFQKPEPLLEEERRKSKQDEEELQKLNEILRKMMLGDDQKPEPLLEEKRRKDKQQEEEDKQLEERLLAMML